MLETTQNIAMRQTRNVVDMELLNRLDEAARALMGYVVHQVGCLYNTCKAGEHGPCTCGLDHAILLHKSVMDQVERDGNGLLA